MSALWLDGRWIDGVLALIVLEGAALAAWSASGRLGLRLGPLLANLGAGGFLLLAARLSGAGASAALVAAALAGSLAAHLFDLANRWRAAR